MGSVGLGRVSLSCISGFHLIHCHNALVVSLGMSCSCMLPGFHLRHYHHAEVPNSGSFIKHIAPNSTVPLHSAHSWSRAGSRRPGVRSGTLEG